jgi:hypothetical protein
MWHCREVFAFLVWRDVKIRYRQTLLGVAWAVREGQYNQIFLQDRIELAHFKRSKRQRHRRQVTELYGDGPIVRSSLVPSSVFAAEVAGAGKKRCVEGHLRPSWKTEQPFFHRLVDDRKRQALAAVNPIRDYERV